ncbi:MAG: NHL repeat-containing protein [Phycisphaerales bacterium]|nr:NHL repeat-containing protein [Phycisphaerales bacterium]
MLKRFGSEQKFVALVSGAVIGFGGQALAQSEILVADTGSKVVRFTESTGQALDHFIGAGISPLSDPREMVIGPDGRLYIASRGNGSVLRYNAKEGFFLDTFVTPGFGGLSNPEGMTFGPDGWLYVSSRGNNRIIRYNPATGASNQFVPNSTGGGTGGLNRPKGLAFGPDGHLYVASSATNSVLRFDGTTGEFIDEVVTQSQVPIAGPRGLLFDGDGYMYVASSNTNSVIRVAPVTLTPSVFIPSASGGLDLPHYMAFHPSADDPQRTLLVASTGGNGRVLRYRGTDAGGQPGSFLGVAVENNAGGLNNSPITVLVLSDSVECRADFNNDGVIDADDFFAFLSAFAAGCD